MIVSIYTFESVSINLLINVFWKLGFIFEIALQIWQVIVRKEYLNFSFENSVGKRYQKIPLFGKTLNSNRR